MRAFAVTTAASPRPIGGGRAGLFIGLALAGLLSCKTTQPKEEIVVMVDTAPPPSAPREVEVSAAPVDSAARASLPPPPMALNPSIMLERLEPVRGGAKHLPAYRGPGPCKMALTGSSPVAKACSQGGTRKAIELMQTFVRRAKAEGFVFQCADCHPDEDDFSKLAPDADNQFRELLFLARPAD
jgi:hypothetical protein